MLLNTATLVYISVQNGVWPAMAHLDRTCSTRRSKPPNRVETSWGEALGVNARLCTLCSAGFDITGYWTPDGDILPVPTGRPSKRSESLSSSSS